jgi:hypothetical protein
MAVKLNQTGYQHAQRLVRDGRVVLDDRDEWSEHQPSAREQNDFLDRHGFGEYRRWFLGVDDEMGEETKGRYKFPYGDFDAVHRCAVMSAESRAAQRSYGDIESAAAHLHGMLEALR